MFIFEINNFNYIIIYINHYKLINLDKNHEIYNFNNDFSCFSLK